MRKKHLVNDDKEQQVVRRVDMPLGERIGNSLHVLRQLRPETRQRKDVSCDYAFAFKPCEPFWNRIPPQYQFLYRLPFELQPRIYDLTDKNIELSCVNILSGLVSFAADLRFNQRWQFRGMAMSDISSSISLAPGEKLTITVRKTQRTQLNESTMQSTDSLQSSDSTVIDKDVLNVARSTAQTQQWHVDGSASVSIGTVFKLGASGGFSNSVTNTSNSTVEHIAESTEKTSRRLQTLQKIEVARQSETTMEDAQSRTIVNPYRDRGLTLNVYELNKCYTVTTEMAEIRPVLILEITDLDLNREFILGQGSFLDATLLDRTLAAELRDAMQAVRNPVITTNTTLSRRYARLAFHYLFEEANIFNVDGPGANPNDPWSSFLTYDGLHDAINNHIGRVFTTLGVYLRAQAAIYGGAAFTGPNVPQNAPQWPQASDLDTGHDMEIEMALALSESIKADWGGMDPNETRDVLDHDNPTEILRRVSGFISIVDGLLRPLLKPTKDEADAASAGLRAENVIERVSKHVQCNRSYYVQKFLDYLCQQTQNYTLSDTLTRILSTAAIPGMPSIPNILELFNPRSAFLDGFQFVVPMFDFVDTATVAAWLEQFSSQPLGDMGPFSTQTADLAVPCDGFHIEPLPGICVLPDVPPATSSVTAAVNIDAAAPPG